MKTVFAARASAILYNLLAGRTDRRPLLLPANICPIVPATFLKAGLPYEFVDIAAGTLHMDLDSVEAWLKTGQYGGLLYAHPYGDPATPDAFFTHIRELDESLLVIDDRCLCPPELTPDPARAAPVLLYSTGYAKIVDAGYGGYAFLPDDLPYHNAPLKFEASALQTLEQAYKQAIASGQAYHYRDTNWLETDRTLPPWEEYSRAVREALLPSQTHRQAINQIYDSYLPAGLALPPAFQGWRYNILVPEKQRLLDAIFAAGLFASSHYASLAGIFSTGSCPQAENLAGKVINLFNDHHYTPAMAEQTCEVIRRNL